ncbi:diacylglycerol kinase family protein [Actinomadura sp. WMMA1423]|uniref:diacylglycerol/lipid kinase family protein n=1 Tax=Actinomadura sp. WMMA1423 TaxID=2591108 RepID=UPI00114616FE|nr:diacylglycerol kinase family protein [Actinomadura sp. WMMA1423]
MILFTNAKAGTHDAETLDRVAGLLRDAGREVTVCPCVESGDLDEALDKDRKAVVVAAGGDGSINRLVGTLHRRGELDRTVGLVPMGTGNDLARNLGIPLDPQEAARLLLDGGPRELDMIVDEDGRATLNAVHVGIGASAAQSATRFKSRLGPAAFPVGAVLAGVRHSGWRLRIKADGEQVAEGRFLMAAITNAPGIAGGSAQLATDAHPGDGRLELVVSAATGPIARIAYALRLRDGSHRYRDDVLHTTACEVTISGQEFRVNSDGEVSGPYTSRTWTLHPGAWRLIAPSKAA